MLVCYTNNNMEMPSKKVSILLILVVLVVTATISSSVYFKGADADNIILQSDPNDPDNLLVAKNNKTIEITDSDEDGLADWEETLHGTDPNNKDTDGDGANDKEEIDSGRDPLEVGPGKPPSNDFIVLDKPIYENYVEGTLSDRVAKNLATNFFQFKYNDTLSSSNAEELVNAISSSVEQITDTPNTYNFDRLRIAKNPSKEEIKFYGNSLATLQAGFMESLIAVNSITDSKQHLASVAQVYRNFSTQIINLTVPETIAQTHLNLANNFDLIGQQISSLKDSEKDPVLGLFAVQTYQSAHNQQAVLYKTISNYFKQNGILFDNNDVGSIWNDL